MQAYTHWRSLDVVNFLCMTSDNLIAANNKTSVVSLVILANDWYWLMWPFMAWYASDKYQHMKTSIPAWWQSAEGTRHQVGFWEAAVLSDNCLWIKQWEQVITRIASHTIGRVLRGSKVGEQLHWVTNILWQKLKEVKKMIVNTNNI